jgi:mono/diheme cytochrome c family protein
MRTIGSYLSLTALSLLMAVVPASAQEPALEKGQQVFAASKCAVCHSVAGKGNPKGRLDTVGTRLSADDIREWIINAPAMAAKAKAERKPQMKPFPQLVPDDVSALVVYLSTLKK